MAFATVVAVALYAIIELVLVCVPHTLIENDGEVPLGVPVWEIVSTSLRGVAYRSTETLMPLM